MKPKKQLPVLTICDEKNDGIRRYVPIMYVQSALRELLANYMQGQLKAGDINNLIKELD